MPHVNEYLAETIVRGETIPYESSSTWWLLYQSNQKTAMSNRPGLEELTTSREWELVATIHCNIQPPQHASGEE
jgi:hypothetical protein